MYTVVRITGACDQLELLLNTLKEVFPAASAEVNRRGHLVCDLSSEIGPEHWVEVAGALDKIGEAIDRAQVGDVGILVDTQFDLKFLPDGGIAIDTMLVSLIGLEAMTRLGADFEITTYRPSHDDVR